VDVDGRSQSAGLPQFARIGQRQRAAIDNRVYRGRAMTKDSWVVKYVQGYESMTADTTCGGHRLVRLSAGPAPSTRVSTRTQTSNFDSEPIPNSGLEGDIIETWVVASGFGAELLGWNSRNEIRAP
jgi:hypothetical protein